MNELTLNIISVVIIYAVIITILIGVVKMAIWLAKRGEK